LARTGADEAAVAGELILIVEDNDKNLKLVRDVLRYRGYRTLEARTAAEGLALAVEHRPTLVLLDIQLPDLDGVSALSRLRASAATAELRVIALTAFAMKQDRERFLAAGFDGYIAKPIDIREFPNQVRQFCERSVAE
jgi:two-component system cell cycle response regulator DivK